MTQYVILKDLAIIFAVSLLVVLTFHRLKLPALPGFIVAGVVLGPNALGLVADAHQVESLAEVGVILLLFTIGIGSPLAGQTLAATGLRKRTGALVLSVTRGLEDIPTPGPQLRLAVGDVLVVVGQPQQLRAAAALVAGTGAAEAQRADKL